MDGRDGLTEGLLVLSESLSVFSGDNIYSEAELSKVFWVVGCQTKTKLVRNLPK